MRIVEIVNFLNDPEYVLKDFFSPFHKLDQQNSGFKKCSFFSSNSGIYSGYRRPCIDDNINQEIATKIEKILNKKIRINITYNINNMISIFGAPHIDSKPDGNNLKYSGVIYLNKDAPKDTGTTLYEDFEQPPEYISKMQILYSQEIPPQNSVKQSIKQEFLEAKLKSKIIRKFENRYNCMIMYDGAIMHSPDNYFGIDVKDSRHTIAFFAQVDNAN